MKTKGSILILSLLVVGLCSCRQKTPPVKVEKKVPVRIGFAGKAAYRATIHASGRLYSKQEMKLSFKTGGIIDKILVKEGQHVKKTTRLATLKPDEINAMAQKADFAYKKAVRDFNRLQKLFNDSVATREQLQNMQTALDVARKNRDIALFNKKHAVISAPSQGVILKIVAEENEITAAGMPVILFASEDESWIARVSLVDKEIVKVNLNDSALIFMDAFPGDTFYGRVTETGKMADPYTSSFEVEISVLNPVAGFSSGMIITSEIVTNKILKQWIVPVDVLEDLEEYSANVFVLQNGKAIKKPLVISRIKGDKAFVSGGITNQDTLIVSGGSNINSGSVIEIIEQRP